MDILPELLPIAVDPALATLLVLIGRFSSEPLGPCSLLISLLGRPPLPLGDV